MENLHKKKFIISFLVIMAIVIIILCKFLSWHETRISEIDISGIQNITAEEGYLLCLDSNYYIRSEYADTSLNIRGWSVIKDQPTNAVAIFVLLRDTGTDKVYKLPTIVEMRQDVTTHVNSLYGTDINYDYSGFYAKTACGDYFDFDNNTYEMGMLYKINGASYVFFTGRNIALEGGSN